MKKEYILCVDSDGCAMDTMDVKHIRFFGPLAADVFGIQQRDIFLKEWNRINLYSMTRGINRFKGLALALTYAQEQGETLGDISPLLNWAENAETLSNQSLKDMIAVAPHASLEKALDWSYRVNHGIETELAGQDRPFDNVLETLRIAHEHVAIAIVSSANSEAILSEWTRHGLLTHVDYVFGQEKGSKAAALKQIKEMGYDGTHILMVGDAPGDQAAAKSNHTLFYPILFGKEAASWQVLQEDVLPKLIQNQLTELDNQRFAEQLLVHLNTTAL